MSLILYTFFTSSFLCFAHSTFFSIVIWIEIVSNQNDQLQCLKQKISLFLRQFVYIKKKNCWRHYIKLLMCVVTGHLTP